MLATLGNISLHLAFVTAAVAGLAGVISGQTGSRRYYAAACNGTYVTFGLLALASSILIHAFATHNFDLMAVAQYSDTRMHWMYLMAAFWGGQAGSLMFWTGTLASFSAIAVALHRRTDRALMPWFIAIVMGLAMFLMFILLIKSNPFDTFVLSDPPKEGQGLNPLLQTPLMVMHPPSLLTGYVAMALPFAFAMAALISGRLDNAWLVPARRWVLVSWLFLSIGNMLGGMWAYEELGWGGYWAWDPVENAALMPWIASTAFIHSMMIQERRGMLKRWNVVLVTVSFLLTLTGTFITRSGLIDSVHTFAQSDIGNYFFALLLTFTTLSAVLLIYRWGELRSAAQLDSPLSREAVFVANNWILVGMTFVVFWGTLFPKFKEMATGDKVSIGPPWFNQYLVPLGIILVFLMGVGTLISWKKATWKNFRRNFLVPVVATLILAPALCAGYWFLRAQHLELTLVPKEAGYAIGAVFASVFVFCATASEYWRGIAARMRSREEGPLEAALNLLARQRRRYGGYIVHVGFILAIIGFSGAAFKVEQDVTMRKGEMVDLGDYLVRYDGLTVRQDKEKELIEATVTVLGADGTEVTVVKPAKAIFHSSPNSPTSEIAIDTGPVEDLYFALAGFDDRGEVASFKMVVSPLVWWFWFGGTVLIFGTLICLWPEGAKMPTNVYRRAARGGAAVAVLAGLSFSPLALWTMEADAQPAAQEHKHDDNKAGPVVRMHDPRLKRMMMMIRIKCDGQGNPIMANSKPSCPDFQRDLALLESMIREGKSDDEILAKFVEMRGEEVLAVPPDKDGNWLAWALPIGLLVVSVPLLSYKVFQWSRNSEPGEVAEADDEGAGADEAAGGEYEERLRRELAEL